MKLLTQQNLKQLPDLYSQENVDKPIAQVKWFCPWSDWTWYLVEFDHKGGDLCYGLVIGHEIELGYFSMREIEQLRGPGGLRIERDTHFEPIQLYIGEEGMPETTFTIGGV